MGESVWWGMFRAGNNRGETFRGEFSGGEYSSHQKNSSVISGNLVNIYIHSADVIKNLMCV